MNFNRRIFLLRYLLLSIVGLLAPLLKSRSSSAQTPAITSVKYKNDFVPGVTLGSGDIRKSSKYKVEVRVAGDQWENVPAYETRSKAGDNKPMPAGSPGSDIGYYYHLQGWTHTYVNFEAEFGKDGKAVEVKISRTYGDKKITLASVHPRPGRSGASTDYRPKDNVVICKLTKNCLIAVDINGQMDDNHTGAGYKGEAIHTISIFANPPLLEKPNIPSLNPPPNTPTIIYQTPGGTKENPKKLPTLSTGQTLVFLPGIHVIPSPSQLTSGCSYYIPENAIVYGTFNGGQPEIKDKNTGKIIQAGKECVNVRIFGHGILSGSMNRHPGYDSKGNRIPIDQREANQTENDKFRAIAVNFAKNVKVDGITIVDAPQITISLTGAYEADTKKQNAVRWVKMIHWRENSDAILNSANTNIADCFLRNQDDSLGIGNPSVKRVVQWNDANGIAFKMDMSKVPTDRNIVIEDCDVIYTRCIFPGGGQVFVIDGDPAGRSTKKPTPVYGKTLIFRGITIEDPKPSKGIFYISQVKIKKIRIEPNNPKNLAERDETPEEAIAREQLTEKTLGSVIYDGITFENLTIKTLTNHYNQTPTIRGLSSTTNITNVTFKNLKLDKTPVPNNLIPGTSEQFFVINRPFATLNFK
jgi:hypothetical protein